MLPMIGLAQNSAMQRPAARRAASRNRGWFWASSRLVSMIQAGMWA